MYVGVATLQKCIAKVLHGIRFIHGKAWPELKNKKTNDSVQSAQDLGKGTIGEFLVASMRSQNASSCNIIMVSSQI